MGPGVDATLLMAGGEEGFDGGWRSCSKIAKTPMMSTLNAEAGPACSFMPQGSRVMVKMTNQAAVSRVSTGIPVNLRMILVTLL
jgi:hypothetical protein